MLVAVALGGCCLPDGIRATVQPYEDLKQRKLLKRRAARTAREIVSSNFSGQYADVRCNQAFQDGFKTAFEETSLGGNGCPPPVPPKGFFSSYTLTHSHPPAVPWYNGYRLGYVTALAHGVDRWRLPQLDPELMQCGCQPRHSLTGPFDSGYHVPMADVSSEMPAAQSEQVDPPSEELLPPFIETLPLPMD